MQGESKGYRKLALDLKHGFRNPHIKEAKFTRFSSEADMRRFYNKKRKKTIELDLG